MNTSTLVTQLIDQALAKEQASRANRERSGKFSPSMLGRCIRAQVYNKRNVPQSQPLDARTLRVFKCGQLFHDFVQQFLPEHQCEVPVDTDLIHGFADIVTEDAVWDIKSQHSQSFWYMEKSDYDIAKERYTNILQVTAYATILNRPKAMLLFLSKDDLTDALYEFDVSLWRPHVDAEFNTLWKYLDNTGALPLPEPRAYGVNKKTGEPNECMKYCPWRDICFEAQGKQIPTKGGG